MRRRGIKSVAEAQQRARRRLPTLLAERIVDGNSTNHENVRAFRDVRFIGRAATTYRPIDLSTTVLGQPMSMPVLIAPTGLTRLVHPDGELALSRAAAAAGVVQIVAMGSGHPLEELSAGRRGATWQQLTMRMGQRGAESIMDRAGSVGSDVLVVTVDSVTVPSSFGAMPKPSLKSAIKFAPQIIAHPEWFYAFRKLGFDPAAAAGQLEGDLQAASAPSWDELAWFRDKWAGRLVIKGVTRPDDAKRAVAMGADAIVVSNHGGLTLPDQASTLSALPAIVDTVGDAVEVLFDGGIRRGADIAKALAIGARAVIVGRATLFGLAVGGEAGATEVLELLRAELQETITLLGAPSLAELDRSYVTLTELTR